MGWQINGIFRVIISEIWILPFWEYIKYCYRKTGNCKVQQNSTSRTSIYFQEKNEHHSKAVVAVQISDSGKKTASFLHVKQQRINQYSPLHEFKINFSRFHWSALTVTRARGAGRSLISQAANIMNKALLWIGILFPECQWQKEWMNYNTGILN